jgi:Protein of unknown function (DUF1553)/Protein of unknown function (DUF1549)/Planctomycete cytochrome C
MNFLKVPVRCAVLLVVLPSLARAQDISYNRDIRPILSNHCFKCHGPDLKKGGLDLQVREMAIKPRGQRGPALVPGKSGESRLIERISSKDEMERMPPKGKPLTAVQIATLKTWIDQSAKYEEHWAYVKPSKHPLPAVQDASWPRNAIDFHVLARLEKEGLKPAPEADRATLIRRVSFDLTGLPPTVAEVDAFLNDTSPDAYEKVVQRLLASPHYGEHQALSWLDQARYADTNGYEKDERRSIHAYRDWVIDAFNRDLPFDRFTIEQLAGDLLPGSTLAQKVATGFHRNTMTNTEGGTDDEEFRVSAVVDRVNTTMEVWMGLTLACAQCHNHKFDPFSQKEYYQLFAFLNNTTDPGRSVNPTVSVPGDALTLRRRRSQEGIAFYSTLLTRNDLPFRAHLLEPIQAHLTALRKEDPTSKASTTLILQELPKPRATHILLRGNHKKPGDRVAAGVPAKLHPLKPGVPANRLGLAKWLVDPDNPLVGRVTMNRIWGRYFGKGFVETGEDFGVQGELPTHPELLDWLALELIEQKWSLKAMHRLIVTSATYRQSSKVTKELVERDPFNRLFARGPRIRLSAEMIRDNALAVSGLLERKLGGASVFPYQPDGVWFNPYSSDRWVTSTGGDQYRRGLYTFWRRTAPYAAFMAFDAPSREITCERRPRTNTPLQALATLNDRTFVQPAAALARRMMKGAQGDKDRAILGFRLCVARMPRDVETDLILKLYRDNLAKYRKDTVAAKELATSGLELPKDLDLAELAAWTVVANVLLNLDETITKG